MARKRKSAEKVDPATQPPLLGVLSNLFRGDPPEVAEKVDDYSLEAVQLVPRFATQRFSAASEVTPASCQAMVQPFLDRNIIIAAVSAHTNLLDPDDARRERSGQLLTALIDHCGHFACRYLVTETGTLSPERPWQDNPENHTDATFALFLDRLAPFAERAQAAGVSLLLEGHLAQVVDSLDKALEVRKRLGSAIQFVMDPVNYMTRGMASSTTKQLPKLFAAVGEFSPIAHAKDIRYTGGEMATPRAGLGTLDYKTYLELLHQYQPDAPLILEQLGPEHLRETIDFLDGFFED